MKTRLLNLWESVGTSFWFVPALMVVGSIGLSFVMVALDKRAAYDSQSFFKFLLIVGPEGARSILSTIAGSMITVAGVVFSITIVTLTLASSQFGPRLLRNFMRDTGNKIVLGTFIATFIYCLLVLRSVHTVGENVFVPCLSVNLAIVLALTNLGVLIYFIHHVSTSIQADHVIAAVYHDLEGHLQRLFPEESGDHSEENEQNKIAPLDEARYPHSHHIAAPRSGYLQAIDNEGLLDLAREHDLILDLQHRPGGFVVMETPLTTVKGIDDFDETLNEHITKSFIIGAQRTPEQDPRFEIHQLTEIAIRALSPGINDPFTAMTCIDRLGSALCYLANRTFPSPYRYDNEGRLRIIAKPLTFADFTSSALGPIRQYGRSSVVVTIRLLESLQTVASQAHRPEQMQAILHQAGMIERGSDDSLPEASDRDLVKQCYRSLLAMANEHQRS